MLQSITTAKLESVSEGPAQSALPANRGDSGFSALMDKQCSGTDAGLSVDASLEAGKAQASIELRQERLSAEDEAAPDVTDGENKSSHGVHVATPQASKSSKTGKQEQQETTIDFLQHLQASLVTPTELGLPKEGDEAANSDSATDSDAVTSRDVAETSSKTGHQAEGGKLLPQERDGEAVLSLSMLPLSGTSAPVGSGSAAEEQDAARELMVSQDGGQSSPKPGQHSAAAGVGADPVLTDAKGTPHLLAEHARSLGSKAAAQTQTDTEPTVSLSSKLQVAPETTQAQEPSTSTDFSAANKGQELAKSLATPEASGKGGGDRAVASSSPQRDLQPAMHSAEPMVERNIAGAAATAVADGAASPVSTERSATATAAHPSKSQAEPTLGELPQGDTQRLVTLSGEESKANTQGKSNKLEQPVAESGPQTPSGMAEPVNPSHLVQVTHATPALSGATPLTAAAERGSEIYRELAAVNMESHSKAAPELAERLTLMIGQKWQEAELELEPRGMGKMTIQLSIGQDQQASVQFIVQQHHSREAVEQTLPKLREMLAQQGIQLNQATVQQQASGQGQSGQSGQWSAQSGGEGSGGRGHSSSQGRGVESPAGEVPGQNLSVRSRQAAGIDFYA